MDISTTPLSVSHSSDGCWKAKATGSQSCRNQRYDCCDDFKRFGRPRLFFGISGGNLDSIVANYTSQGKVRDFDAYSAQGNPWRTKKQSKTNRRRPDRAAMLYAQLAREAYHDTPVVLGGIEASLRRFVHYDYKQERLRGSVLTDAKADLLVYGMGERAVVEIADRLHHGRDLDGIAGTCRRMPEKPFQAFITSTSPEDIIYLPSWQEMTKTGKNFLKAELILDKHIRSLSTKIVVQKQQSSFVIQHSPPAPLNAHELDALYDLPFTRRPHPSCGDIPAYRMIRHSVTIVRGCSGNCSFCAITRHQGPLITSRSRESILTEVRRITTMTDFHGTISDLGGPTANLYGTSCTAPTCRRHDCLFPQLCTHLKSDEKKFINLLDSVLDVEGVKHVFISSGLRMELLLKTPRLLEKIIKSHTPGAVKIAPEHTEKEQLLLMHKEPHSTLCTFIEACTKVGNRLGKMPQFTPYVITGHPGSTAEDSNRLVQKMKALGLSVRQFQDFTPTPGTISTAMFYSGYDHKGNKINIPDVAERKKQRQAIEKAFIHKKQARKQKSKK